MQLKPLFLDEDLQKKFEKYGFVKIKLLSDEDVSKLRAFFYSQHPSSRFNEQEKNVKYHFTFLDANAEYKKNVFDFISGYMQPKLDKILANYAPLVINFVNKEPGLGEVPVHQNWNFVDETKYVSVSIWCPLINVDHSNGTLEVIPGSHRTFRSVLRSPSIPWFFTDYVEEIKKKYLTPISVNAGEVLIFDDSIIHYSKPNSGNEDRLVIQIIAKPEEAIAKHYYMQKGLFRNKFIEMDVNKDFFLNFKYHITDKPEGALKSKDIDYKHVKIDVNEFDRIYREHFESLNEVLYEHT